MTKLRKFFASSVMILTVLVMSGFSAIATPASAAASAGDLIKKDGLSAVYYLGDDGKRYVFPNEATYKSWYSDFSGVVTVSSDELSSYPLGGNVVVRPGTKLVKITTDPKVYAVEANGVLRQIPSEAAAIALYGSDWAKRVIDVADSFFVNYTIGSALASNEVPAGSLVKKTGESSIYYYDGTNYRLIEDEVAFSANRFQFANVLTLSTFTAGGSTITGAESSIIKTSQAGGSGTVVTGSGLTVALSSATPESQNIPYGSSVEFLKINLTAANDGAINVSSIKLTAYGLSNSTYIDDVTFYDNGVKVGTAKSVNSDGVASFNFSTPVNVNAGATKTLIVKATIESGRTGSFGLGIASASDIVSSAGTVSGSFPVKGNLMSAVASSIGTLEIKDVDASQSVSFGEDDVLLADFTLSANNVEDALLQSIALYNGGTNTDDIVSNLKLYIDGTEIANGTYANRYATFNLDNFEIQKSDSVSVEVRGDIGVTNTSDTIKFYLKDAADLLAIGQNHGFGLAVTNNFNAILTSITLGTGDFTIDMDKSSSGTPAKDVKAGDDNVDLATLVLESNSENATVNDLILDLAITGTTTTNFLLENVELVEVGGGTYDLTLATTSASASTLTLDDEISLVKGVSKKFKVRADVLDSVNENVTFKVSLNSLTSGRLKIEGDVSNSPITDIVPSNVDGATITVKAASLSVNTITLNNGTYVGGAKNIEVFKAKLKTGTADGVKVSSIKLTSATSSVDTNAFTDSNITKLDLYVDDVLVKSLSNKIASDSTNGTITFNSLDYSIAADHEATLVVKATFASTVTAGDFKLKVASTNDVVTRSLVGSETVVPSVETTAYSKVVTLASVGYLNVEMLTAASNVNKDTYLLAGSETEAGHYLGELKFTAGNESVKVKTLTLTEQTGASTDSDIESVKLVDASGNVVAETSVDSNGDAVFSSFNVTFEAKSTSLYVVAKARGINVDGDSASTATEGNTAQYKVTALTASGANSGTDLVSHGTASTAGKYNISGSNHTTNTTTIVASKLNIVEDAMGNQPLVGGLNKVIGKYKLVFDNGSNRNISNEEYKADLTELKLTIATSSTTSVSGIQAYIEGNSAKMTSGVSVSSGVATIDLSSLESVDGEVTLIIIGDVTTSGTSQYLQTSIATLSSDFKYNTSYTGGFISKTFVDGGTLSN